MKYKKPRKKGWNAYRSKWKAAMEKGMDMGLKGNENILYLGASSGTTISYLCKLTEGIIFGVEKSSHMAIALVRLAQQKSNIAPVFCDARDVDFIRKSLFNKKIDILFQDIPSLDQAEILIRASQLIDKKTRVLLSLKTQSISQKNPKHICNEVETKLKRYFKIKQIKNLEPYHKKHYFFVMEKI